MIFEDFLFGNIINKRTKILEKEYSNKLQKVESYLKRKNCCLKSEVIDKNNKIKSLNKEITTLSNKINLLSDELSNYKDMLNNILPISKDITISSNNEIFFVSDDEILIYKKINKK